MKKVFFLLVKLSISSTLLYIVLRKAGINNVISTVKSINPLAFAFAVFVYIFAILLSTFRWKMLLPSGRFKILKLYSLYMIGAFFNNFLPGVVGGDAVKAYYLYNETGKGSLSLASVFIDRYIGFVSLMAIGLIAFPFGYKYFRGSYVEWLLPAIVSLFALMSFLIFWFKLGKRFKLLSDVYEYVHYYKNQRWIIIKALFISAVIQTLVIISIYILTIGLGQEISIGVLFIFVPIITSISMVPISIFGIGLRESSFVFLFGILGINPAVATAVSFSWFLSTAVGSLPGAVEYLKYKKGEVH